MKLFRIVLLAILVIYVLPPLAAAGLWYVRERPQNWYTANWSSAGLLPKAGDDREAAIYVLSAATGGLKGAAASHAWIVTKNVGDRTYNRYDKVGWGTPIRRNMRDADGAWYSNPPRIVAALTRAEAARLIPQVEASIQSYAHAVPIESGPGRIPIRSSPMCCALSRNSMPYCRRTRWGATICRKAGLDGG